jgi:hypothetical protein
MVEQRWAPGISVKIAEPLLVSEEASQIADLGHLARQTKSEWVQKYKPPPLTLDNEL